MENIVSHGANEVSADHTRKQIYFTIIEEGMEHAITTYNGEYRNLMVLIKDRLYIDGFGECGGLGRCATCVIKISGLPEGSKSSIIERNEPATIAKMGFTQEDIRLACQIYVTEDLNNVEIELVEL